MQVFWLERAAADVRPQLDWLGAGERERLHSFRVPKRAGDWRLGRWTAKHAIAAYLHLPPLPATLAEIEVWPAPSGAPEAFIQGAPAGLSVSLSHRAGRGACAVAPAGINLGCDLEFIEPRCNAFVADYFTAAEQSLVYDQNDSHRFRLLALLWCAKESVLKALHSGLRLDPRSIEITFEEFNSRASGWQRFHAGRFRAQSFQGWWQSGDDFVRSIVSDPASSSPTVSLHAPVLTAQSS